MSDYEQIFHKQELYDMYSTGEEKSLDDLYGIEDLAMGAKGIKKELEWLKGYKNKKNADIDQKVKALNSKLEFFKKVILATLKEHKEKGVDFPGSCKVTSINRQGKWNILDEEEFISIIEKAEQDGEKVDGVVEEVKEFVVRKKAAGVLLDLWTKNGTMSTYIEVTEGEDACVKKDPPSKSVSFTYPKEEDDTVIDETPGVEDVPVPSKDAEYDSL